VHKTAFKRGAPRLIALATVAALLAVSCSKKNVAQNTAASPTPTGSTSAAAAPPVCPLTGAPAPAGNVPQRPVYAVKVPNDPSGRPQTGLDATDIVYEEPVEGGITRLIAVFQCTDAARIEPIRSARFVDIDVLQQFGKPIFGNAGGIGPVLDTIKRTAFLINAEYSGTPFVGDYHRDSSRAAPQNLYTSTAEIYQTAGAAAGGAPKPVFTFSATVPPTPAPAPSVTPTVSGGAFGTTVHVPFSGPDYDVVWKYDPATGLYRRNIGTKASNLSTGAQITARNIVVESVSVTPSQYIEDAGGSHENLIGVTGSSKAVVCSLGVCVLGTWSRPTLADVTKYLDPAGNQIPLTPGNTWVELQPNIQKTSTS
jgi:hypothetical protein